MALGLVTGEVELVESYRAIRFLPSIAQQERRPMLNALRYFARHDPSGSYLRLVVATAGPRVPLYGDLRGEIQRLNRRVSRFASLARQRFGIEVVYRGTEFTVDEALTSHVHANILLAPREALPRNAWSAFLAWMHAFFGAHVHDAGRLRKPEEAIKYPFKPADLARLDGPALAWVYRRTQKLKIAQPLGAFRKLWRRLDRDRLKVMQVARPAGGRLKLVEKPARVSPGAGVSGGGLTACENQVLCLVAPQARFSRFAEPVALIRCQSASERDPASACNRDPLEPWLERGRADRPRS